jgi:acetylornithine deacetylase/succinyl-diaminopimelate desuccinylase-like protein
VSGECATLNNRLTGSDDLALAVDYVAHELEDLGYEVEVVPWWRGVYRDRNVFATKTGVVSPTEQVFFVAHVDGVATCPAQRCPAADDNASGTVAGLELARSVAEYEFERTLVLMFSTGEEQSMQGVRAFIERASPGELADIKYVVNLDMVGYDGNKDRLIELYYGEHDPSERLARLLLASIEAYDLGLNPQLNSGCG